jgi:hypothetical protein
VAVVVPSSKCDDIDVLLAKCNTVIILGYADPKKIAKVIRDYEAGRSTPEGYEIRPGRDGKPYCQIKKLENVDELIKIMTKDFGKPYLNAANDRLEKR